MNATAVSPRPRAVRPATSARALLLVALAALVLLFRAPLAAADRASVATTLAPDGGRIVIEAQGLPPPAPVIFSATAQQTVRLAESAIETVARVKLQVRSGHPLVFSLGLAGEGSVTEVTGAGLRDWAVRQVSTKAGPRQFLDLRPLAPPDGADVGTLDLTVRLRIPQLAVPGPLSVPLVTAGDAIGFTAQVALHVDPALDYEVKSSAGLTALAPPTGSSTPDRFTLDGDGSLQLALVRRGAAPAPIELTDAQLVGRVDPATKSVAFHLVAKLHALQAGARLPLLSGHAALDEKTAGDGWHVELAVHENHVFYDLVAERTGVLPLDLAFAASIGDDEDEGVHGLDFVMPAGTVVPLRLEGLPADVKFSSDLSIVPTRSGSVWLGFIPADGRATLAWAVVRQAADGTLFFSSSELAEVRVGAGLLRQESTLSFRVLQGKLASVRLRLEGPGDIVGVTGANVVGWNVAPDGPGRILDVRFSRPIEKEDSLQVRSQSVLDAFPVRASPLRLVPLGSVRHSGFVRIANNGAVRLEVSGATGLMQLAPNQFPGAAAAGLRQVFVYRFPSSNYGYTIAADRIQPEIGVSQVVTYELGATDRVIAAVLELDVREAPVRDWSFRIPEDYAVVTLAGDGVADHAVESEAHDGYRTVKVLFDQPVQGRQLLALRLEKNQPPAAGAWVLPPLEFPGAKSVRGHVGVVSAPGFRIVPATVDRLVEVPVSFFPRQAAGLQQAWRLRDADWRATVRLEALGQSVQADVFHLYSLKEGVVYGSVLINYFVVGAPVTEWRIHVPDTIGNIDLVGQNVRRDWHREGDVLVVALHQPVLGAATLLVTFEQPMSARGGTIHPGEVQPLGVQAERGYLQVVSPLQVKSKVDRADGGLLKLEPLELPPEYRLLTTSPSLAVYQYTARPFALDLSVDWYPEAPTVEQVVDYAQLSSQVSREGQVQTTARYFVKTRGRKALRFSLPAGVALWEARVDRDTVTAGRDGDQILVPLPARANPNVPVEVDLQLGQSAVGSGSAVTVAAPTLAVPAIVDEWTIKGDPGRLLVPGAASAELLHPVLTETGFEWIVQRGSGRTLFLGAFLLLGLLILRFGSGWRKLAGVATCVIATGLAVLLAFDSLEFCRANSTDLDYAATMLAAGQAAAIHLANVPPWRALVSWWGVAVGVAGLAALAAAWLRHSRLLAVAGAVALGAGLLAQRTGAAWFFWVFAMAIVLFVLIPQLTGLWQAWRLRPKSDPATGSAPAAGTAVVSLLALLGALGLGFGSAPRLRAADDTSPHARTFESMIQHWTLHEHRLSADVDLAVRGTAGDSLLLLRAPAVLADFSGDGLRVGKLPHGDDTDYYVYLDRDGTFTAHFKYELPIEKLRDGVPLATAVAALQRISVDLDQPGWEFASNQAVRVAPVPGIAAGHSGAILTLLPAGATVIAVRPQQRDVATERTRFFTEAANLYVPGPGVVNGYVRLTVRPAQGRVSELDVDVPAGFTVGDVTGDNLGLWRFDPDKRRLHIAVEPAQAGTFKLDLAMQRSTGALPQELALEPVRVAGTGDEVGLIALAFGDDAQPENVRATGFSPVSTDDFDASLVPTGANQQPTALVQQAWRYGREAGRVELRVAPVAPEIRATARQLLTFDDDRLVDAVDLNVAIARVGVFSLSFELPAGLEVEALSGPALNNWTEATEQGHRIITLHLNGRTLGEQRFTLSLAGAAPHAQAGWSVPKILIREASRQTGELLLVPGRGLSLRALDRREVAPLDPRSVGGMQPGTLAFRLLQADWELHVGIAALDPWITVQALDELTLHEGQTLTRLAVRYRIENAALKQVRLKLPGLTDEQARTLHATGAAVADFVKVPGETDTWAVHFQRGIAGETDVQIEYQGAPAGNGRSAVAPPVFVDARQGTMFVAVRSGGRLDLDVADLPRGWQRADWAVVPAWLQSQGDHSVPALCFRVAEPERPLAIAARRHGVAEALKLRVNTASFTTVFSPAGASLTAVDLKLDVTEKGTLRLQLPAGAQLFNAFVNGESATVVREGDTSLFHVSPNTDADQTATVRLVYSMSGTDGHGVALAAPGFGVPLENISWRVMLPPGFELAKYSGSLRLAEERVAGPFAVEQYQAIVSSSRSSAARQATALIEEANKFVESGDQVRASEVLSRAAKSSVLDQATNEDARVQLRELKTQQAVVGLNTRRQRLYFGNRSEDVRNEQLEQAATLNPFMQGKFNFNPSQFDQLLMGNTLEENTALRGIAGRIVEQQLAAEPVPTAIDVTLAERGRVETFTRSLQVDGRTPLALELSLDQPHRLGFGSILTILAGLGLIVAFALPDRARIAKA